MENVYIVGIIAAVILCIVLLLRNRITGGHIEAEDSSRRIKAGFEAAPPNESNRASATAVEKPSAVIISGNWMIGANVVRVLRNSVQIVRNRLLGKQRLEVKSESSQFDQDSTKGKEE